MNIGIVGYGRMGRMVRQVAQDAGITIGAVIDPCAAGAEVTSSVLSLPALQGCDAVIDFSIPSCAVEHIAFYARNGIPAVIGTTGWYDQLPAVTQIVSGCPDCAIIWSGNFSLGVHLFFEIVRNAAAMVNAFDDYDVLVHELHHGAKADSPSGTAQMLGEILLSQLDRKDSIVTQRLDRKIQANEMHVSSTRGGFFPGTHTVYFDSPVDTIEITHTARSREGFARGAVKAASWIASGRRGFFTLDDMMASMLQSEQAMRSKI